MFAKIKNNFPIVYQHDSMECGVACLSMVCKYYGMDYSLNQLSQYCIPTSEGISLFGISEAANNLGLHSICGKTTLNQLIVSHKPCILHWNQNHFVVLYKIKQRRNKGNVYYIADPSVGLVEYSEDEFLSSWISIVSAREEKGIALYLQPTPLFKNNKTTNEIENRSFGFLFGYIKQYRKLWWQIIVSLFLGSIIQLIFPFLTQAIVDVGISGHNIQFIYLVLLAQLVLTISRSSADFIRRWLLLHISMRVNISLVSDFFIKLLKLPMSFFDTKQLGDIMERMNDHVRIDKFLTTQMLSVMFSIITLVVFILVLMGYSIEIFVTFLIGSLCYAIWVIGFLKRRKYLDYLFFEKQAINSSKTYQFITSMQEIKLQNCEQRRRWEWEDIQADMFNVQLKNLKLQQIQEAGSILINETKNILITVIAATSVINGDITIGMMLAIQYIIGQLNVPIDQLMNFIYSLQDVKISLERINEIHKIKNEQENDSALMKFPQKDKGIYLNSINFKYDKHTSFKNINNISLSIPYGKTTAIVGTSGSGKTTLIKLILGFYPVDSGEIIINGSSLNKYNLKWWRKQCGIVMQNGVLFAESIARNIAVDDDEININQLIKAAKIANIDDFIMQLPLKYDTIIGQDGIKLSEGQKQRILIARAVYKEPQFLILDEATNSLDANNEKLIVNNLMDFYRGKTVIVIAHRLSTVKNADQIVVIDNGNIVEIGSHDSLVELSGKYYNLVKNQLELGN